MSTSRYMAALDAALAQDRKTLAVKRKLVAILRRLPDDAARERVLVAAGILLGVYRPWPR